ncbi:hypothetical protein C437_19207 [Haloarcula vallismortis ATCC 29715]|nr:hypothetical protein C437_19207 [Haloarcula vallismortis ATCC 29715]
MSSERYNCPNCGAGLSYQTTKHNGCPNCSFVPPHSAE